MATTAKQAAKELIKRLPDQSSWDDIMYQLDVKQKSKKDWPISITAAQSRMNS
jgi:hypothetical protein